MIHTLKPGNGFICDCEHDKPMEATVRIELVHHNTVLCDECVCDVAESLLDYMLDEMIDKDRNELN